MWWFALCLVLLCCCCCACAGCFLCGLRRRRRHAPEQKSVVQLTKALSKDLVSSKSVVKLTKEISTEIISMRGSAYKAVVEEDLHDTLAMQRRVMSTVDCGVSCSRSAQQTVEPEEVSLQEIKEV